MHRHIIVQDAKNMWKWILSHKQNIDATSLKPQGTIQKSIRNNLRARENMERDYEILPVDVTHVVQS